MDKTRVGFQLENVRPEHDNALFAIIRSVLTEIGENKEGTVFVDESIKSLSTHFFGEGKCYFVVIENGTVLGGCGIAPLEGYHDAKYCELQRMFLLPQGRGNGAAKQLMEKCLEYAKNYGYTHCYIETMESMQRAVNLYSTFGFMPIPEALGTTGHHACKHRMLKEL